MEHMAWHDQGLSGLFVITVTIRLLYNDVTVFKITAIFFQVTLTSLYRLRNNYKTIQLMQHCFSVVTLNGLMINMC